MQNNLLNFPYSVYAGKRNLLEEMDNKNNIELGGFANSLDLGVCLTNAMLTIIVSSESLMVKIKRMVLEETTIIDEFAAVVQRDPHANCFHSIPLISAGDLLRHNLIKASNGQFCGYRFGLAGTYYLLKQYLRVLKTSVLNINMRDNIRYLYVPTHTCLNDIQREKLHCHVFDGWQPILTDLFHPLKLTVSNFKLRNKEGEGVQYFREIHFLNIGFTPQKTDTNALYSRLPINLFETINMPIFQKVGGHLMHNGLIPKHISFNYRLYDYLEIHPATVREFANILFPLKDQEEQITDIDFHEITVISQYSSIKLPKDFKEENLRQKLVFGPQSTLLYDVQSISFLLLNEREAEMDDIIRNFQSVSSSTIQQDELETCSANIFHMLTEYLTNVLKDQKLLNLADSFKDQIIEHMEYICRFQFETFYKEIEDQNLPCHFLTLARRNNKWIVLNDDFIADIVDWKTFYQIFKYEHVSSIMLDKVGGADSNEFDTPYATPK
ncbi:hypothetical protein SNEBB_008489 [Seison nebaliae]|nr:hypothetical protein SNEBB_008489 [Seison nebaliae]